MGTSTPLEYAAKMRLAETAARGASKEGTEAGALLVKRLVLAQTPEKLSGVGKNGRKIGVRYRTTHELDQSTALVFATGPFQLLERDTKAHDIPRTRGSRARKRYAVLPQAVSRSVGGGESRVFASVKHPGTKGKHPFEKGVLAASALIGKQQFAVLEARLRTIF